MDPKNAPANMTPLVGFENDRTDVLTFQCALSFTPVTVARALEENQSVLGSDPKLAWGFAARINVGSTMRKSDRHKITSD